MADPIFEVVEADAELDALSSPTSSDVWRKMHGHSTKAVAAIAARRAKEGGGASLPAWWTVVSTPGAESVEFAGVARIAPTYSTGVPLTIEALTPGGAQTISEMKSASVAFPSFQVTIDDLGNAAFMLFDENEEEFVKLQTGAFSSFIKPTDVAGIVGLDDASGNGIVEVLGSGMLGFFGVPHVVQQTLGATPTGAEIRAVLVAYGLVAA